MFILFFWIKCSQEEIQSADNRLNLTDDVASFKAKHYPQGEPLLVSHIAENPVDQTVCVLVQEDYITGFSHEISMPIWSSYSLSDQQVCLPCLQYTKLSPCLLVYLSANKYIIMLAFICMYNILKHLYFTFILLFQSLFKGLYIIL